MVLGATGFVGKHLTNHLLAEGYSVTGVSREERPLPEGALWRRADVVSGEGLEDAMEGAAAVINLVGIIRERGGATFERVHVTGAHNAVKAMRAAGVKRLLQMSALGAAPTSDSAYQRSKARAEAAVAASGVQHTVLRPSLIFGPGDEFFGETLKGLVTAAPVVPVVGSGEYRFRPIYVGDVARAFASALRRPETIGGAFDLTGPAEYTLRELLRLVMAELELRKPLVGVPLPLVRFGARLLAPFPWAPVTPDQLAMLVEGSSGNPAPAARALGLNLTPLKGELAEALGVRRAAK